MIDVVSPEDIIKWFRTINSVFEKHGIAGCVWSYKEMDFRISDSHLDGVCDRRLTAGVSGLRD